MYFRKALDFYALHRNQWKAPQAIREVQERKLKHLINHAYENVPYYRELLDSSRLSPRDIGTVQDLQKLPLTSKRQLQDLPLKEKIARNVDPKRCESFVTSGTTGIPLRVYYRPADWSLLNLCLERALFASGMKPWDRRTTFTAHPNTRKRQPWYRYLGLLRRRDISVWNSAERWLEETRNWEPQVLIGYVMVLKLLAQCIRERQINDVTPRIVFSGSGVLDDFTRRFLGSVFKAKIVDFYGSYEAGYIAWECEQCCGYHICADMIIVEILKDGKPASPGQEGEVVITNLHSYAMPFIRYRQEDVAVLSPDKPLCGRNLPLLKNIQGRADDCVILRNGRKMTSQPFYHAIEPASGIRRWRVVQENINTLRVEIEPDADFDLNSRQMIENNLKRLVTDNMEVEISLVDSIPADPSYKFRQVTSKVSNDR